MANDAHGSSYIPTLDGWRAIAVAVVIGDHFARGGLLASYPELTRAFSMGHFGVDFFFAISGFLITSRLLTGHAKLGTIRIGHFYARRVFRILPPAFLLLTIAGVFALSGGFTTTKREWVAAWLFFSNYVPGPRIIVHLWSLAVEEHFYFVWPILFLVLMRQKRAVQLGGAASLLVAIVVWRTLVTRHVIPDPLASHENVSQRTDLRFDALLGGCIVALLRAEERGRRLLERLSGRLPWLCLVALFFAADRMPFDIGTTLQTLTAPLVLVGTTLKPTAPFSRILEGRAIRFFGRLSYSLYLFQQPFMKWDGTIGHPWLILPVACVSYYLVEQPMIRLGRDILAKKGAREPTWPLRALAAGVALAAVSFVAVSVYRVSVP